VVCSAFRIASIKVLAIFFRFPKGTGQADVFAFQSAFLDAVAGFFDELPRGGVFVVLRNVLFVGTHRTDHFLNCIDELAELCAVLFRKRFQCKYSSVILSCWFHGLHPNRSVSVIFKVAGEKVPP